MAEKFFHEGITPLPGPILDAFDRINGGIAAGDGESSATTLDGTLAETVGSNITQGRDSAARGVYAGWPAMTPKYMRHRQNRNHEYFGTMARMYIRSNGKHAGYERLVNSLPSLETQDIARTLIGNDRTGVGGLGYIDFILQQAGHSFAEKFQVVETLSDNYVSFFFGQQAPIFNYSGTLLNTYQDDWAMNMYRLYHDIARGSKLAKRGLLFYLRYDSMIVSGALTAFNFSNNAEMEMAVPFTLQMLVKKVHVVYGGITTPTVVPGGDAFIPDGYQLVETVYESTKPKIDTPTGDPITSDGIPIGVPTASAMYVDDYNTTSAVEVVDYTTEDATNMSLADGSNQ